MTKEAMIIALNDLHQVTVNNETFFSSCKSRNSLEGTHRGINALAYQIQPGAKATLLEANMIPSDYEEVNIRNIVRGVKHAIWQYTPRTMFSTPTEEDLVGIHHRLKIEELKIENIKETIKQIKIQYGL